MSAIHHSDRDRDGNDAALTILQLDTHFPRLPGDVASTETYQQPVAVKRIPKASVATVVTDNPDDTDITAFETAACSITSPLAVTSCGFLGYWQGHLNQHTDADFVASVLVDLPRIMARHGRGEVAIVTFDAATLNSPIYAPLLKGFDGPIIGLGADMHLRRVIAEDLHELNKARAEAELINLLTPLLAGGAIKALVLECTNLPPYKAALKTAFDLEIYDILTSIDWRDPDLVKPEYR